MVTVQNDYADKLTCNAIRTQRCQTCVTRSCMDSDRCSTVVPVLQIMNRHSRATKVMRGIIYHRPRLEHTNNVVSWIF